MGEFGQQSFMGGMNLLLDDTRLSSNNTTAEQANNQYRVAFNSRNRYDVIDSIPSSVKDNQAPSGVKQEFITFGNYLIMFVAGSAYYRYYTEIAWTQIIGFSMTVTAPRYWTCAVPISITNYVRFAATDQVKNTLQSVNAIPRISAIAGAAKGNLSGLLVQDNITQPQFIYLDTNGIPQCRTTQSFDQWRIGFTSVDNTTIGPNRGSEDSTYDYREYVPVGNCMAWVDGVLYIVSQDYNTIYRSVSGRPLDFVVNVTNLLQSNHAIIEGQDSYWQLGGGDATTTSYSVGVGGITCIRPLNTSGLFVSASNANFSVTRNMTQNAPMIFGEYTFIRTFLFNASNISDRTIIDSLGDTRFIDLTGIRSFNAVQQLNNEGRNSVFSSTIAGAFSGLTQDIAAAILFNNYELYAVNSIFGPVIAVFDTISGVWSNFDSTQVEGKKIKMLAKIELDIQALYAVTEDDSVYQLYASSNSDTPTIRLPGMCPQDPKKEQKVINFRCILSNITKDYSVTASLFVNNRFVESQTSNFRFVPATKTYVGQNVGPEITTQTNNILFSFPNSLQGWKAFVVLSWTGGASLVFVSMSTQDNTPMQPSSTQAVIKQ